jgi:hypothetical protein
LTALAVRKSSAVIKNSFRAFLKNTKRDFSKLARQTEKNSVFIKILDIFTKYATIIL